MRRRTVDPVYAHKIALLLCDIAAVAIAFYGSYTVRNGLFGWQGG